ncbi:MAG: class I SAM-dependent methyltransferase [Planctomycetaceae bacterium]|nr:class I SAM-dependent methyltransferase [Planctomycetaceae bacterium]
MQALEDCPQITIEQCDQCGSDHMTLALDAKPWTLMRCEDCGFVFTSPRLTDESLARIYSSNYYENAVDYASQQVEPPSDDHLQLASRIRRLLRPGAEPLTSVDVGCGGGRLVEAFSRAGFQACGIEPSEGTVAAACRAGRDVRVQDLSELPSDAFDCVTLMHVLEHVTSPASFAADLYRVTRPGGYCVVEVPNFGSRAAQEQGAEWYPLHPSTHLSHFTPQTLRQCLTNAGFGIVSTSRLGGGGVFDSVSEASPRQKKAGQVPPPMSLKRRALAAVWGLRSTVTSLPAGRRFARWVNWELLGHGEFVRVTAQKN